MARRIEVELVGDSRSLERAFKRSEKSAKNFNGTVKKTRRGIGAGGIGGLLGGIGIGAAVKGAVQGASDMEQQLSKVNVVFGESADEVEAWSKTTSDAFGISRREALSTAGSFGALFKPIGLVGPEAAEQSRKLTELGADLASFYNTDVQEALDAIRSGLVGESEPLRRYGVLLSETRVKQQAMADTGKKNASALTDQEKAAARVKLMFQDASVATGDFARTSDTLANKAKIAQANFDDLNVTLGTGLIPKLTIAADKANALLDALSRDPRAGIKKWAGRFGFLFKGEGEPLFPWEKKAGPKPGGPPGPAGPLGGMRVQNMTVNLHGVQNVPQLENELAKRRKGRPHARRGAR